MTAPCHGCLDDDGPLCPACAALDALYEPCPPTEPPVANIDGAPMFCPDCGAPRTWDHLDGSVAYYCVCPSHTKPEWRP